MFSIMAMAQSRKEQHVMSNKFVLSILSVASITLLLTSCNSSSSKKNYPTNASDKIVDVNDNPYNSYEKFYDAVNNGDTVASKVLDKILLGIADEKMNDTTTADWIDPDWLKEQEEQYLIDAVSSGTYDKDYKFNEEKYVASLTKNLYNVTCPAEGANKDYVITSDSTYADIFKCDYSEYIEKVVKPSILKKRLISDYIYNESYSSIGSTNARKVKLIAISDSTDKPGMAAKLVKYFVKNYIDTETPLDGEGNLEVLGRLWRGIDIKESDGTTLDTLHTLGITTLNDKIDEDVTKIDLSDKDKTDLNLESKYTGSYTYSLAKGIELARNSLRKEDYITEGYYLKSNGLSSLPSELKSRIFTSNYNIDSSSTKKDVTVTMKNGKRYLTSPLTESNSTDADSVVYYDSSSKTYYIVEINDVITNSALERKSDDSEEVAASKKARALEVAYEMTTTSNYEKNSTVHYLKNAKLSYHDEDVYNYIKTNYPDVFEEDK